MQNVTVDDNDPSITYQPTDSWVISVYDVLDAGGTHHVTSDPDATASFTFTGWFSVYNILYLVFLTFFFFLSRIRGRHLLLLAFMDFSSYHSGGA